MPGKYCYELMYEAVMCECVSVYVGGGLGSLDKEGTCPGRERDASGEPSGVS